MTTIQKIALTLHADDVESFLRQAADDAARYSALVDHMTPRTYQSPWRSGVPFEAQHKEWNARFLRAKRIVEAFGVEYEMTSEAETLTVHIPMKGQKRKMHTVAGLARFATLSGGVPDLKHPLPCYFGGVHAEACRQAADRTVRKWRAMLAAQREAA